MEKIIDCFIVGHNEMDFAEYEKRVRKMGVNSGAYRDLNLNYLRYNNRPYQASEIFNLFCRDEKACRIPVKPVQMLDTFSATIPYLGTYLSRRGFTFDYVVSFQEEKEVLAEKLQQENILAIAVTTTLYVSAFPIIEIIEFIKKYNRTAKIIVGGPFISTQVRVLDETELETLFNSTIKADFYVNSSQGEATLVKLLSALKSNSPPDQINNIYYRADKGLAATPILKENNKLSENTVNWDLFTNRISAHAAVRTSISCPFSCAFCGYPEHAGPFQTAAANVIEKELNQLDKIKTLDSVYFIDDTFNVPVKRFKEILRILIKNKYSFKWHSYFRCQYADNEMVELMKESGCEGVYLGIESGSDQILKNMNKAVTVKKYLEGIQLLKKYGIIAYGNFIIGFPGETHETVQDTIAFIKESGLDFYRVQLWYCDTITPIWKEREKYDIKGERFEWSHVGMDSRTACDLIDEIFLTTHQSTWVPQYNFNFDCIWHLVHQGLSFKMVKNFLDSFNRGIKEKLTDTNPSLKELSFDVINQLINYQQEHVRGDQADVFIKTNKKTIDKAYAEFDF